jgi:hypothetical protein
VFINVDATSEHVHKSYDYFMNTRQGGRSGLFTNGRLLQGYFLSAFDLHFGFGAGALPATLIAHVTIGPLTALMKKGYLFCSGLTFRALRVTGSSLEKNISATKHLYENRGVGRKGATTS